MTKKITSGVLLLFILVTILVSCQKEQSSSKQDNYKVNLIPEQLARSIAEHFSPEMLKGNSNPSVRTSTVIVPNRTVTSSTTLVDKNNTAALYVFNYLQDSGYVVVSADAKHEPICAYIERGNANQNDSVPAALMNWFDKTIENVEIVREGRYDNTARARMAWNDLLKKSNTTSLNQQLRPIPIDDDPPGDPCDQGWYSITKGPLLQATWGQGCSYNDLCPSRNCTNICWGSPNAWTSCVATEMSQVIRYWHPNNSYGYNYATMPNGSGNVEVQRLMRDAGHDVLMNYGCGGSGADGGRVPVALKGGYTTWPFSVPGFGFSSATRGSYNSGSYLNVKQDIDNNWPVLLEGCAKRKRSWIFFWKYSECHEWVTDGYISTGNNCYGYLYFHMNWGWHEVFGGNDHNGWFGFNNWAPTGTQNFQYAQDYCYNIHP